MCGVGRTYCFWETTVSLFMYVIEFYLEETFKLDSLMYFPSRNSKPTLSVQVDGDGHAEIRPMVTPTDEHTSEPDSHSETENDMTEDALDQTSDTMAGRYSHRDDVCPVNYLCSYSYATKGVYIN